MANHDERKDVRLLSRIAKIDSVTKTITIQRSTLVGIHSWGKIDYLCNVHKYHLVWEGTSNKVQSDDVESTNNKRNSRKQKQYAKNYE